MRKILSLLFILICSYTFAQPVVNRAGAANTVADANLFALRSFRPPVYADTTAANNAYPTLDSAGKVFYSFNDKAIWFRQHSPKKWVKLADQNLVNNVTGCYGLLNGGIVTWSGGGLVMNVTASYYVINCNYYNADGSLSVTLSTADPTNPRIDVIAVDTSENIVVITGTPGATPVKPQVNPTYQVELTEIYVPAGATTPQDYTYRTVYNENVEWTSGSTLSSGTVNFNSTVFPSVGTKNLRISASTIGHVYWDTTGAFLTSNYQSLSLRFSFASNPINDVIPYIYLRDNGVQVTYSLSLDGFGYSSVTGINEYNVITIPMSAFTFTSGSTFDGIGLYFGGMGNIVDVDYVQLQTGTNGGGVIGNYLEGIRRLAGSTDVEGLKNGVWQYLFTDSTGGGGGSTDTTSLSNRINQKQNISDTNTVDATRYWVQQQGYNKIFTNGLTESGGTVTLTNDTTAFANSFYGTNAVGRRGYRPLSEIMQNIYNSDGTLTGNRTVSGNYGLSILVSGDINYGNSDAGSDFGVHKISLNSYGRIYNTTSSGTSSVQVGDNIVISPVDGLELPNIPYTLSTTGKKIMLRDTATGLVQNIDPALIGGTPSGNYGNVQLNRNGVFSTPSSDSLTFSDKLNVKGNIIGTNKLILGASSAPSQSQIYVTGGLTGGNIDARGDSSSAQKDEANIEVQHADYDGSSFTGYGVALQANGNVSSGTLLGYSNKNSAQLRFTGDVNVIRTLTNRSLRFGVNNVEKLVLDSIGRVGICVINPDSTLHVNGSFKLVNGTQGSGKVLTSDANGGASWQTPATVADTSYTTLASFTAGAGFASDTTMCTDSTLFGSFYTGQFDYTIAYIQAVIKGNVGDSIVVRLIYNDTFNVAGTEVNNGGFSVNNRYTGNQFNILSNRVVPAGTWLWLKPKEIITGKKPKYISVTLIGYKTYVTP